MVQSDLVQLAAGPLELELSPSVGGGITRFDFVGEGGPTGLLRKCNSHTKNVLELGSFPLVPFVNRIRGGAFQFRGREVRLLPNMAGDVSPLHGQGWLAPWQVVTAERQKAEIRFVHASGEWPWAYEARQHFVLDESGLSLALTCRNQSDTPMPCGLGQHPYFPCGPQTLLDTQVETVWTIDEHVLPVAQVRADGRFDLRKRAACGQDLDHGFGGWSGRARLADPGWPVSMEMSSPQARFFQLYSPPGGDIFVAEPVTHANAALNAPEEKWADLGMTVLEPGEEMRLDMRLDVGPR